MKKFLKILMFLLIIVSLNVFIPANNTKVYASSALTEVETAAKSAQKNSGEMGTVVGTLLGFLQVASALIAVVMIAVTGFRYIVETPEVKSELKKNMVPIIAGILLVFFAVSITRFFVTMFESGSSNSAVSWRFVKTEDEITRNGVEYVWKDNMYVEKQYNT